MWYAALHLLPLLVCVSACMCVCVCIQQVIYESEVNVNIEVTKERKQHILKQMQQNKHNTETYQCSRSACRKADRPSIIRRIATVRTAKKKKTMDRRKNPPRLLEERPMCITMDHSTSDNSVHRTKKAHRFYSDEEGVQFLLINMSIFILSFMVKTWG